MASLANTIPSEVMGELIIVDLRKQLVAADVCNNYADGLIQNFGDSVKIPSVQSQSVSDYTKNSTITYGSVDSASVILQVNQQKYFASSIDSIDERQSVGNIAGIVLNDGVAALAEAADSYILQTTMSNGAGIKGGSGNSALGTSTTPLSVSANTSGVLNFFGRMMQRMDESNVPQAGRWAIIPPWMHSYVVQNKLVDARGVANDEAYSNGKIGRILGFDLRVSSNATNATTGTKSEVFAGYQQSVEFADNLVNAEIRELETKFGEGVRGLYVYGSVVARANTLLKAVVSQV